MISPIEYVLNITGSLNRLKFFSNITLVLVIILSFFIRSAQVFEVGSSLLSKLNIPNIDRAIEKEQRTEALDSV
jgi:hypothetical protein